MLEKDKLEELVISELAEILETEKSKITLESTLMDDLGISSLEVMVLIGNLEAKTGVTITQQDIGQIESVSDIIEIIRRKQQ